MDTVSPVTADKYRGNIYTKFNYIDLFKFNKQNYNDFLIKLSFNIKFLPQVGKIKYFNFFKSKLLWINNLKQGISAIRQYYSHNMPYPSIQHQTQSSLIGLFNLSYGRELINKLKNISTNTSYNKNVLFEFKYTSKKRQKLFLNRRILKKYIFNKTRLKKNKKFNKIKKLQISNTSYGKIIKHKMKYHFEFILSFLVWKLNKKKHKLYNLKKLNIFRENYINNNSYCTSYKLKRNNRSMDIQLDISKTKLNNLNLNRYTSNKTAILSSTFLLLNVLNTKFFFKN
jgi:hypothetical protein